MGKFKIKRGLSDSDMIGKWQETPSFEHATEEETPKIVQTPQQHKKESFFTPDLQDQVAKKLLEIKLALYQQGVLDYDIKVSRENNSVILTAVPRKSKVK